MPSVLLYFERENFEVCMIYGGNMNEEKVNINMNDDY